MVWLRIAQPGMHQAECFCSHVSRTPKPRHYMQVLYGRNHTQNFMDHIRLWSVCRIAVMPHVLG